MKRSNTWLLYTVSALIIGVGTFLLSSRATTLAEDIPKPIADNSGGTQITPEIRDLLQKNQLRPAQFQTPAPDFTLRDLDGQEVRLSQFRGETVLLGFFTTW